MTSSRLRLTIGDEDGRTGLTAAVVDRLTTTLQQETPARFVTLEGAGDTFCAGLDLAALAAAGDDAGHTVAAMDGFAALLRAIEQSPRPVIALVDGSAMGGGLGLAAAADIVLATPRATFGLPETLFGLIPALVFPVVARRIGSARTRWLALGAPPLPAAEAWRLGLVDDVGDDLNAMLARCTNRLVRMDPRALAELKALVAEHYDAPAAYRADATARFGALLRGDESRARLSRFVAGDTPWPGEVS